MATTIGQRVIVLKQARDRMRRVLQRRIASWARRTGKWPTIRAMHHANALNAAFERALDRTVR